MTARTRTSQGDAGLTGRKILILLFDNPSAPGFNLDESTQFADVITEFSSSTAASMMTTKNWVMTTRKSSGGGVQDGGGGCHRARRIHRIRRGLRHCTSFTRCSAAGVATLLELRGCLRASCVRHRGRGEVAPTLGVCPSWAPCELVLRTDDIDTA